MGRAVPPEAEARGIVVPGCAKFATQGHGDRRGAARRPVVPQSSAWHGACEGEGMRPSSLALGLASLVATLVAAEPLARADAAGATAPARCGLQLPGYSQGIKVPSNAPALLVSSRSGNATAKDAALVSGETRSPLGAQVTDSHALVTLPLPADLATGTYSLEYGVTCTDYPNHDDVTKLAVEITAPVAFPTETGTLSFTPEAVPTGVEKITLVPSPALRAFLDVAVLDVTLDGEAGRHLGPSSKMESINLTVAVGDACIVDGALHREKRVVKVSIAGTLAGVAARPAPATIDVPVDCGAIKWTDLTLGGSGNGGGGTTTGGTGGETTPSDDGSTSEASASCSAAPLTRARTSSFAAAAVAVSAVVAAALGRRRRRAA